MGLRVFLSFLKCVSSTLTCFTRLWLCASSLFRLASTLKFILLLTLLTCSRRGNKPRAGKIPCFSRISIPAGFPKFGRPAGAFFRFGRLCFLSCWRGLRCGVRARQMRFSGGEWEGFTGLWGGAVLPRPKCWPNGVFCRSLLSPICWFKAFYLPPGPSCP